LRAATGFCPAACFGSAKGFGAAGLGFAGFFGSAATLIVAVCGFGRVAVRAGFLAVRGRDSSAAMARFGEGAADALAGGEKLAREVAPAATAPPRDAVESARACTGGLLAGRCLGGAATANSGILGRLGPV
jgi:hypothetical protein